MNSISIPIAQVHLEVLFQKGSRTEYALLEPQGGVSPLRIKLKDLRAKLGDFLNPELKSEQVVERINMRDDRRLVVTVNLDRSGGQHWDLQMRVRYPESEGSMPERVSLSELRQSSRMRPEQPTDIKLELGESSIEGTLYNISEHGLGIALLTSQFGQLAPFKVDQEVELVGEERLGGRIRSQYPADGGCVLGIELKQRFDFSLHKIEA